MAWWEGEEIQSPSIPEETRDRITEQPQKLDQAGAAFGPTVAWQSERKQVSEMIWGQGFNVPGRAEFVLELVKPFGLTSANTMLQFGVGLGGGLCAITEKFGNYISAFDVNTDLAKLARDLTITRDVDNKITISADHPDILSLKPAAYDGCLVREMLTQVIDQRDFVRKIYDALKSDKSLVVSDYFLPGKEPGPNVVQWHERSGDETYPSQADDLIQNLKSAGFQVRVREDDTGSYSELVRRAWAEVAKSISNDPLNQKHVDALNAEIEVWKYRQRACDSGELTMRRIVAYKKSDIR